MEKKEFCCGLDEAGRGPLAGPVVASCVILPTDFPVEILADSKKLSEKKRNVADEQIREKACFGIGIVDHKKIDEINILQASLLAMKIAFEEMFSKIDDWAKSNGILLLDDFSLKNVNAIVDGTFCPKIPCACRAEPKADAKYPPVMAASILAKVKRDALMREADLLYPGYGYASHKGYPTKAHFEAIERLGFSPIQRLSFSVKKEKTKKTRKKSADDFSPTLF